MPWGCNQTNPIKAATPESGQEDPPLKGQLKALTGEEQQGQGGVGTQGLCGEGRRWLGKVGEMQTDRESLHLHRTGIVGLIRGQQNLPWCDGRNLPGKGCMMEIPSVTPSSRVGHKEGSVNPAPKAPSAWAVTTDPGQPALPWTVRPGRAVQDLQAQTLRGFLRTCNESFPLAPVETGGPVARAPRHPSLPMSALSLGRCHQNGGPERLVRVSAPRWGRGSGIRCSRRRRESGPSLLPPLTDPATLGGKRIKCFRKDFLPIEQSVERAFLHAPGLKKRSREDLPPAWAAVAGKSLDCERTLTSPPPNTHTHNSHNSTLSGAQPHAA